MKRFLACSRGGIAAALILAAPVARAQTTAPKPPPALPPSLPLAPEPPLTVRIVPTPDGKGLRVFPPSPALPGSDPALRMAPMPNLAPGFGKDYFIEPMPGANGEFPGVTPRVIPRQFVVPDPWPQLFRFSPATPTVPAAPTAPRADTMVVDGNFLYILRGDTVLKMDKKTLKVVESTTITPPTAPAVPNTVTIPRLDKWPNPPGQYVRPGIDEGIFIQPK